MIMHLHTKVNHRKRKAADKAGTSDEDEPQNAAAQQDAAQILAKSLPASVPASALQEAPAAEPPATASIPNKGPSANTLRQKGREYKPPAPKAAPRAKRGLTGSSSDAYA